MGTVDDLGAHECTLCPEDFRIDFFGDHAAGIIIAVAGIPSEMHIAEAVFAHGGKYFILIVSGDFFAFPGTLFELFFGVFDQFEDRRMNAGTRKESLSDVDFHVCITPLKFHYKIK